MRRPCHSPEFPRETPGGVTFVPSIKELNWATYVVGLLMCLGGLVLIARP